MIKKFLWILNLKQAIMHSQSQLKLTQFKMLLGVISIRFVNLYPPDRVIAWIKLLIFYWKIHTYMIEKI